jgi:hypothetical protein
MACYMTQSAFRRVAGSKLWLSVEATDGVQRAAVGGRRTAVGGRRVAGGGEHRAQAGSR